ncbi:HTH_Tnp_Tc3_2 domain-containing protein [Trichonephila clavipes]|nr:HTH_Tnp_Tc3_2 domain-containing protein [Trichonephila clavipes]
MAVKAKRNRRSTASDLSRQLSSATGTVVSKQTMYRRLGHIGLNARRPVRCVPLTATHCRLRLTWSREHALWTPQQWSCVMFSDESRFSLQSDSRRTLIWRAPGTRYHTMRTPLKDTVMVVQNDSFGKELFLFQNRPACSECNNDRPHLTGCHSGTTCTIVSGSHGC